MQNANEYARMAHEMAQLADQMAPEEHDEYVQLENLIVYHLRTAAKKTRELAEAVASKPRTMGAGGD